MTISDADLWTIAEAGYNASPSAQDEPWDAIGSHIKYCWYLGAQHVATGTATPASIRIAILPGRYLTPWADLALPYRINTINVARAMLATYNRIAERHNAALPEAA